jgi:hypothetical protein
MPWDMGTGNIGTRALCAAVTRAASRAAGQPPARGPANPARGPRPATLGRVGPDNRALNDSAMQHEARTTAAFTVSNCPSSRWSSVRIENLGCRLLARRLNVATSSCGQPGRASLVAARWHGVGDMRCLREAGRLGLGHTIMGPPEVVDSRPRPRDYSPCARPR